MKFLIPVIVAYAIFVFFLATFQRYFMYFPDKTKPELVHNARLVNVKTQDGLDLEGWYFEASDKQKPVIVYFHGNAGHFANRLFKVIHYINEGYGILLAEYRGYGGNPGQPSEQGFYQDGRAYMDWLHNEITGDNIILYGESIGSGAAVQMATEYDVNGLILETPFSSMVEVASKHYFYVPVKWFIKDRYLNIDKITHTKAPLLILHGHSDITIPISSAQKLFDAAEEPKKFIAFQDGNHNNLYDFGAAQHVLKFLSDLIRKDIAQSTEQGE